MKQTNRIESIKLSRQGNTFCQIPNCQAIRIFKTPLASIHTILLISGMILLLISCKVDKKENQSSGLIPATAESAGMSGERLARIDSMCVNAVKEGKIPGVVALVARNGKIVYHKAFGVADVSTGRELKKDDIFRIASQTKAITATAVMMLWEEGKFGLDDPVSKYIPSFKNPVLLKEFNPADSGYTTEPAKGEITIRQLLNHTSGLGYGFIDSDPAFRAIYRKAGIIDAFTTDSILISDNILKLSKLPLHFNPGEKYSYALGLDVLGYLVEILSGKPFDVFLKERIFDPLEMNDTWFYLPGEKAGRLVSVSRNENGQWKSLNTEGFDPQYPVQGAKTFFSGGAGLSSTASDYANFLQMYLNGGEYKGQRLLSRTTISVIMANQIGNFWGENPENYFGLAFAVVSPRGAARGGTGSAGSFGWGGYFNTQYFADPQENLIGILMKQTLRQDRDDTDGKFRILASQAIAD